MNKQEVAREKALATLSQHHWKRSILDMAKIDEDLNLWMYARTNMNSSDTYDVLMSVDEFMDIEEEDEFYETLTEVAHSSCGLEIGFQCEGDDNNE